MELLTQHRLTCINYTVIYVLLKNHSGEILHYLAMYKKIRTLISSVNPFRGVNNVLHKEAFRQ
jgi:hypothetical protein